VTRGAPRNRGTPTKERIPGLAREQESGGTRDVDPLGKQRRALEKKAEGGDVYAIRELREHHEYWYGQADTQPLLALASPLQLQALHAIAVDVRAGSRKHLARRCRRPRPSPPLAGPAPPRTGTPAARRPESEVVEFVGDTLAAENGQVLKDFVSAPVVGAMVHLERIVGVTDLTARTRSVQRSNADVEALGDLQVVGVGTAPALDDQERADPLCTPALVDVEPPPPSTKTHGQDEVD
jgi:hypothetical protein